MSALLPREAYRYLLTRERLVSGTLAMGALCWLMLNPSTATDSLDDQTIRKCIGFTRRWGYERLLVVNLYAYRATRPIELWSKLASGVDVVGPENDVSITTAAAQADAVVCAWGRSWREPARQREERVLHLLWEKTQHHHLLCIGRNGDGSPLHPCMAGWTEKPTTWKVRKAVAA